MKKKQLFMLTAFAAIFVAGFLFFSCGGGGETGFVPPPSPPRDDHLYRDLAVIDDFSINLSSPLNGYQSSAYYPYWGLDVVARDQLGYWFGGVSLGAYLFLHSEPGVTSVDPFYFFRVSAYAEPSPYNSWGRVLQSIDEEFVMVPGPGSYSGNVMWPSVSGDPTPVPIPADAIGVAVTVLEEHIFQIGTTWLFQVQIVPEDQIPLDDDGELDPVEGEHVLSGYIRINNWNISPYRGTLRLRFPSGFDVTDRYIYAYAFYMREPSPFVASQLAIGNMAATVSATHFFNIRFFGNAN